METISLIVPCYNEENALPSFFERITQITEDLSEKYDGLLFEFIFVDDGSKDRTYALMSDFEAKDSRANCISFSRNFGKEAAMFAGLERCTGDYAVIMDCDLQDPPELIEKMYNFIKNEDYDCVATRRVNRKGEPLIRSFFARRFYRIIGKISDTEFVDGARDFRMMSKQVVEAVLSLKEHNRFSKGIFSWVGFKTKWLEYENLTRSAGESKWSFWKLMLYSFDGIVAFSTAPLAISSIAGLIFCMLSIVTIFVIIIRTLLFGDPVAGWPSMICIIFLIAGIQLFCLGIQGMYISKSYIENKQRPIYIIRKSKSANENDKNRVGDREHGAIFK